jgi:hypothetical protein
MILSLKKFRITSFLVKKAHLLPLPELVVDVVATEIKHDER